MNNEIKDWVLVPRKPTPDMLTEAAKHDYYAEKDPTWRSLWCHMLAAAPTPPSEAQVGSVSDEYVLAVAEKLQELHWEIDPDGDETGIKDLRTALIYAQPQPASAPVGVKGLSDVPMTAERAAYFLRRFKRDEKMLGPHEQQALDFAIAALAQQPADVDEAYKRDAKRYRFLRDRNGYNGVEVYIDGEARPPGHLDAQVDAALAQSQGGKRWP